MTAFASDFDRRQLLRLAGAVGLGATLAACSRGDGGAPSTGDQALPSTTVPAPPVPMSTELPPAPVAHDALMLCRDAWHARPALPGGVPQPTITHMTLHHTAVVLGDNRNIVSRLQQHQAYHQDGHGWSDIAYHVAIDRNGNIFELRAPEIVGDTATEYNPTGHFLVLCEGDFDQETVTEAQLDGAAAAFAWAAQTFHVPTESLAGHRDFAATSCPGEDLYTHLASGDLKRRIDDLMATGGVNLRTICGEEAAAVVARIEAGG